MKKSLYLTLFTLLSICFTANAQTKIASIFGDTLSINLTDARGTIQWQSSSDGINWEDIANQNSTVLDYLPLSGTQWVRSVLNEENCPEFISEPVQIIALDTTLIGVDIVVLDTVAISFQPDSTQQANGIYEFSSQTNDPTLKPGDIIIGTDGEGFLRFVDSYVLQNGQLTIHTHQASLDDLFDDTSFSFDLASDSLQKSASGFNEDFDETVLYENGPVTLKLTEGSIGMTGDWTGSMEYSLANGLESFYFGTNNVNIQSNYTFNLSVSQAVDLLDGKKSLATFTKTKTVLVGDIPVVMTLKAELVGTYHLNLSAEAHMNASLHSELALSAGVSYENQQWSSTLDFNPTNTIEFTSPEGQVQAVLKLGLVPKIKMKFYGIVVPYINPSTHLEVTGTVASPSLNWELKAEMYVKAEYGIEDIIILNDTIPTFEPSVHESNHEEVYKTPFEIELVSGDGQEGEANTQLDAPIVIKVKDSAGFSQRNVNVEVEVSAGGGTVNETEQTTNENGLVSVEWTMGADMDQAQRLKFTAKNGSGENINGSPLIVAIGVGCGELEAGTVCNPITGRAWMDRNLGASQVAASSVHVASYGGRYQWGRDNSTQFTINPPAPNDWSIPQNDNYWQGVDGLNNPCPEGFRIPTEAEWEEERLTWSSNNMVGAFNSSLKLPVAGYRRFDGTQMYIGTNGFYWSSTVSGTYARRISFGPMSSGMDTYPRGDGCTIRCIRD